MRKGVVVASWRLHSEIRLESPNFTKNVSKKFIEDILSESYVHNTAAAECLNKVKGYDFDPCQRLYIHFPKILIWFCTWTQLLLLLLLIIIIIIIQIILAFICNARKCDVAYVDTKKMGLV